MSNSSQTSANDAASAAHYDSHYFITNTNKSIIQQKPEFGLMCLFSIIFCSRHKELSVALTTWYTGPWGPPVPDAVFGHPSDRGTGSNSHIVPVEGTARRDNDSLEKDIIHALITVSATFG